MAHEFETGFFVKDAAWHGYGNVVSEPPASVDDAIRLAGLDWNIISQPMFYTTPQGIFVKAENTKALLRDSDNMHLGSVSDMYIPLQPIDAFKWFQPFLDNHSAHLEAAGSLKQGKRIWVLAKIQDGEADVVNGDSVVSYLLLYSGNDGTLSVGIQFTNIRVVCMNTLSSAVKAGESGVENSVRIRHTAGLKDSMAVVQKAIDLAKRNFEITVTQYRQIQRKNLPIDGLEKYIMEVFRVMPEDPAPKAMEHIQKAYWSGAGCWLPGVSGNYWGAYNAVTYWIDHQRGNIGNRQNESWFGAGKKIRDRALQVALMS